MTKDEFIAQIQSIGANEDIATVRAALGELSDSVSLDYDNFTTAEQQRQHFEKDNETLRAANMKLFLRVGEKSEPEDNKPEDHKDEPEKLKFEDLLDEKGGLK